MNLRKTMLMILKDQEDKDIVFLALNEKILCFDLQKPEMIRLNRGKQWAFEIAGAILSFSRRLQDSMAPSGQNFHTAHNLGGRNGILSFL